MSEDGKKSEKNNHRAGGIALGVCLGALLVIGINVYSMNQEKQSTLSQNDEVFQMSAVSVEQQEESNLLEDVANWTQGDDFAAEDEYYAAEVEESSVSETVEQTEETVKEVEQTLESVEETEGTEAETTIETEAVAEEAETKETVANEPNYLVLGNQNVNVRQQPSTSGAKVGAVKPGTKVCVDGQTDGWCHITGEIEGYVIGSALKKIN